MDEFKRNLVSHIPALLRYANALTGQTKLAERLVQDTLERALIKQQSWDASMQFKTWLHSILHHIFIDDYSQNNNSHLTDFGNEVEMFNDQSNPVDHVALHEVQKHILRLSPELKEVLLLVTLDGFDYKSVSQIIDAPIGTVMSRLHRARKQLLTARGEKINQTEEIMGHE